MGMATTRSSAVAVWMGVRAARSSAAAVCIAVVALSCTYFPTVPWCIAQLLNSLWRWDTSLAENAQRWAWKQWEEEHRNHGAAAAKNPKFAPDTVTELKPGESPRDRSRPFIVRGLLNSTGSALLSDYSWLLNDPVGSLEVDYFTNASVRDGLVPDGRASLHEIVSGIIAGGPAKIGTEVIFRTFPHLLDELRVSDLATPLLGGNEHIDASRIGLMLTVPVFMATGKEGLPIRTDLHCEPIGNLVLQLGGRKRWTLVPPSQSRLLKPSLSSDGRAYFVSKLPTENPEETLAHVRRWVVDTDTGDAVYVPTWTWHRVDYLPGVTALSASLFHVRTEQIVGNNPLFAGLVVPNMLKELVGWKTQ